MKKQEPKVEVLESKRKRQKVNYREGANLLKYSSILQEKQEEIGSSSQSEDEENSKKLKKVKRELKLKRKEKEHQPSWQQNVEKNLQASSLNH